ncbi:MAG TPA: (2Fe-2S)-binding protein [Candidatus Binatia bacterium]|jgi:carbon-monoxide dehydrogenase small subunit
MLAKTRIQVTINGRRYNHEVEPRLLLVDYLRDVAGFAGTHYGCDTTSCGACTVVIDGLSAKSCTWFAVQADAREILTVEGLARDGEFHPIQEAFRQHHALQCGFCTPGMLMSAYFLLSKNPDPLDAEIRQALTGNLCRCTGYLPIVEAVKSAARRMNAKERS